MCGIAGCMTFNGASADPGAVEQMISVLTHRGPDDRGVYCEGPVGLAHARLSIIDLAGGHQPMHYRDAPLSITFNGEIFNYRELRVVLKQRGHQFSTHSDTEVILHLYAEYGDACVDYLNGEWAFVIWDKAQRRLFASRDRFGIRPLFYVVSNAGFVFASELKAICQYPGVERKLDVVALDQIFTFWTTLPPRTILENIRELPPAHNLTVSNTRVEVLPYWRFQYAPESAAIGRECERAQELRHLLLDSTRLRLQADVPVAAYLSGGLDSTIVTALAQQASNHQLTTFSVRFEQAQLDETNYQHDAVRFLATDHHELSCSLSDIAAVFPEVIWHAETPILRTAPAALYMLSKLVRNSGYKVVITGEGSDEILGGYDIFKETKVRQFWKVQPESRYRARLLRRLYPYMPELHKQPDAYLRRFFNVDRNDASDLFFSHEPRWRLSGMLKAFFSEDVLSSLRTQDVYHELRKSLPADYLAWDYFTRAQYLESAYLLPGYILSSQGDRVAMAHAIEARHPYLDVRVVEFAAKLPSQLKMKVLCEKYLLKQACADLIPVSVAQRPKQPFRAPDGTAFFVATQDFVRELLAPRRISSDGIFNTAAVTRLVNKFTRQNDVGPRDDMALVGILSTQLFVHQFLNSVRPFRTTFVPTPSEYLHAGY
jgi:asparagine synthase (glutamine-hydrolysing)